ncbi:MAG TPA: ATP-dependent DNA ligase [Solirubrobacteraceae bacterium]|nr:ATP-dependent DNA ligase [Solirubrobacteraceae bacterium]
MAADTPPQPMLARLVRELPEGDYLYEPKWDGFRCLARRDRGAVELHSRHGRPLARYFPEVVAALGTLSPVRWMLDGELLAVVGGRFDFAALMGRLHPAVSRVRALAAETPAIFVAFDAIAIGDEDLRERPFAERRERLVALMDDAGPPLFLTPATADSAVAARWLREFRGGGLDGVVAKHRDLRYEAGARAMLKVKHEQTADLVVAGARVSAEPLEVVALLLGAYDDDGALQHVGVASSFARPLPAALARELAPLVVELPGHPWEHGFLLGGGPVGRLKGAAGRWAPGMVMDWVPLAPERVAEVRYTQVDGRRLRHPARFVRWLPDREPASCRADQLDVEARAADEVL